MRGSVAAWNLLLTTPNKIDNDTLYFIYESNDNVNEGVLYLGQKLISGASQGATVNLNNLSDVYIDDVSLDSFQLLVYDQGNEQWTNASLEQIINSTIGTFTGATENTAGTSGLVPVPQAGDQNKFLRGDSSWAPIPTFDRSVFDVDSNTGQVTLASFANAAVGTIPVRTNAGIEWAPAGVGGISRQIISLSELNAAMANNTTSGNTIYMVPVENPTDSKNLYEEYMVVSNSLELIGTIGDVNLNDYVKVGDLNSILYDQDDGVSFHAGLISRVRVLEVGVGSFDNFVSQHNKTTLVDEINAINIELTDLADRLEWHELPN